MAIYHLLQRAHNIAHPVRGYTFIYPHKYYPSLRGASRRGNLNPSLRGAPHRGNPPLITARPQHRPSVRGLQKCNPETLLPPPFAGYKNVTQKHCCLPSVRGYTFIYPHNTIRHCEVHRAVAISIRHCEVLRAVAISIRHCEVLRTVAIYHLLQLAHNIASRVRGLQKCNPQYQVLSPPWTQPNHDSDDTKTRGSKLLRCSI